MIPRLFTPLALAAGATVQLDPDAAHHALRVLRLVPGAPVELFDGKGGAAVATILSTDVATARVERLLPPCATPALRLGLAQCISAADKMDWTIEKAVELGVAAIVPLTSHKAIVKLTADRSTRRRAHWQRLIIAASAQSRQNRVPVLEEVARLEDWLGQPGQGRNDNVLRLVLDPRAGQSLVAVLAAQESARESARNAAPYGLPPGIHAVWLLCGPESGFSESEFRQARDAGWLAAALGPRVLRTETAGAAALAVVQARWGDLR